MKHIKAFIAGLALLLTISSCSIGQGYIDDVYYREVYVDVRIPILTPMVGVYWYTPDVMFFRSPWYHRFYSNWYWGGTYSYNAQVWYNNRYCYRPPLNRYNRPIVPRRPRHITNNNSVYQSRRYGSSSTATSNSGRRTSRKVSNGIYNKNRSIYRGTSRSSNSRVSRSTSQRRPVARRTTKVSRSRSSTTTRRGTTTRSRSKSSVRSRNTSRSRGTQRSRKRNN